jgi:hypothetical protein
MDRRTFLTLSTGGLLAAPLAAEAQPAARPVRIGICSAGQTRSSPLYQAFEQQLRVLGYPDGPNVSIVFRRGFQGAKLLRERHQLVVAQALVAEAEHVVLLERLAHAGQRRGVEGARQIEAHYFRAERGGEAVDGEVGQGVGHRAPPSGQLPVGRYPIVVQVFVDLSDPHSTTR